MVKKRTPKPRHLYYLMSGTGMIVYWWGVWGLLDRYILPDHQPGSYMIGITAGLALLYLNDKTFRELG